PGFTSSSWYTNSSGRTRSLKKTRHWSSWTYSCRKWRRSPPHSTDGDFVADGKTALLTPPTIGPSFTLILAYGGTRPAYCPAPCQDCANVVVSPYASRDL